MNGERDESRAGPILVSACLLGLPTRYDAGGCARQDVIGAARRRLLVPVCPEQLGGLPTPRPASEIESGDGSAVLAGAARVLAADGSDVTARFVAGAEAAASLAQLLGAREAWLKEGSPSCGVCRIRRGGRDVAGMGVAAALLCGRGLKVKGCE